MPFLGVTKWNFRRKKFLQEVVKILSDELKFKDVKITGSESYYIGWDCSDKRNRYEITMSLQAIGLNWEVGLYIGKKDIDNGYSKEIMDSYTNYGTTELNPYKLAEIMVKKYKHIFIIN